VRITVACALVLTLASCAIFQKVHQEDLQSWVGVPVTQLDKHPTFLTMQLVRRQAADGTEIRDYVNNGGDVAVCSGGGRVASCAESSVVCHNIFYIKNGVVTQYLPTGQCYTDETVRPGYAGPAN
jgi:uncharacterized circularly permuted ATP-grasp superfamily protein